MKPLAVAALLVAQLGSAAEVWPDASACVAAEDPGSAKRRIAVAQDSWIEGVFAITTKGNGIVSLPGLSVRVFDSHDDGVVYRGGLLRCEWQHNGSRLDFVVSGVADRTEVPKASIQVRGIFRYDPSRKRFEVVRCSPEIYHR
jgi:hypothetical protein